MKKLLAFGLIALSLAACNKPQTGGGSAGGNVGGGGGGGPNAMSPPRKAGLWEQVVQPQRGPSVVTQACFDAMSDRRFPILPRQPRRAGACARFDFSRSGSDYVVDSDCSFKGAAGPRVTNHLVVSGDFTAKYTVAANLNIQNAPNPARNGPHAITLTATYKGDCPADIPAGQTKLPDGQVIATGQVARGMGGMPMGRPRQAAGQTGAGRQAGGQNRWNGAGADRGAGARPAGQGAATGGGESPDDDGGQ